MAAFSRGVTPSARSLCWPLLPAESDSRPDRAAAGTGVREAGPDGPHAQEAPQGRPQGPHLLADDHAARHPRGLPATQASKKRKKKNERTNLSVFVNFGCGIRQGPRDVAQRLLVFVGTHFFQRV